jgi:hypothetical protein
MSIDSAPADGSPEASPAAPTTAIPAPPSWPWRRGALFLVGAAQLLTGLLDLQECRFEYGVLLGHPPRLEPDGRRAWWRSPWPTRRGARWPLGRLPPAAGEERAEQCLALTG